MPASMSAVPRPPFLPDDLEQFAESLPSRTQEWYAYASAAYQYIETLQTTLSDADNKVNQSTLQAEALRHEIEHLNTRHHEELHTLERQKETALTEASAVIKYQKEQLREWEDKCFKAIEEKAQALRLTAPTVNTPLSTPIPELLAEKPVAAVPRTPPFTAATPSEASRLSERLPDPEKFEGDRKDLRRFVSQIHEKMNVNRDRYPTPQSRMTYVTNRLRGPPYAQILPYIKEGICQLPDYKDILDLLDRAFGDQNRVNNARNDLFRLRQTNKDFSTFFAEFQRLALEGEMSQDALPTLLEQAISRELRSMLVHNEPPSRDYHRFANFLQDLENRRRHYECVSTPAPVPRTYATVTHPAPVPVRAPPIPASQRVVVTGSVPVPRIPAVGGTDPDAMDTSGLRHRRLSRSGTTRKERGECFRCGATDHLVRDCPHPDQRPSKLSGIALRHPRSSSRGRTRSQPSSSRSQSENGASLE
jgi:hypothetical protein